MDEAGRRMLDGTTWAEFCDTLRAAGAVVLGPDTPDDAFDRAEGFRYLSRLLRSALESFVENSDAQAPELRRTAHETIKMGADNPDNHYRNAPDHGLPRPLAARARPRRIPRDRRERRAAPGQLAPHGAGLARAGRAADVPRPRPGEARAAPHRAHRRSARGAARDAPVHRPGARKLRALRHRHGEALPEVGSRIRGAREPAPPLRRSDRPRGGGRAA